MCVGEIYRIENNKGQGPYNSGIDDWKDGCHNDDKHPSPYNDYRLSLIWLDLPNKEEYLCGFKSRMQLSAWFSSDELKRLSRLGFKVVTIPMSQIEDIFYGDRQVVFRRRKSLSSS